MREASESRLRVSLTAYLASAYHFRRGLVRNRLRATKLLSGSRILIIAATLSCQHVSELWPMKAKNNNHAVL